MSEAQQPASPRAESTDPTTAQLKGEIDSGRTGDKVEAYDPGLSPLGTDDEAAGRPPSPERVALARKQETRTRWSAGSEKTNPAHHRADREFSAFMGFIGVVGVVILAGIWRFA